MNNDTLKEGMEQAVTAMDAATAKQPITKAEVIAKQRYYGMMSGKGFRKVSTKTKATTKSSKAKISYAYQDSLDKHYDLGLEALEAMIVKGSVYVDGDATGKKLTGSDFQGFQDSYRSLLQEKGMAEAKKAAEEQEMQAKDASLNESDTEDTSDDLVTSE